MNFIMGMLKKYNAKLLFTDTNSLVYKIRTDVSEDFYKDKNLFDFSDYRKNSRFCDPVMKQLLVNWIMNVKDVRDK